MLRRLASSPESLRGVRRPRRAGVERRAPDWARHLPAPLRNSIYRRVLVSGLIGYPARFMDITVVVWLVVQRTDTPLAVTLVLFFRFLPFLLAGPVVGIMIDRLPGIRLVRFAQALSVGFSGIVIALAFTDQLALWHLYAYSAGAGLVWAIDMPTRRTYVRTVVGAGGITAALALEVLTWSSAQLVGANLAGTALAHLQPGWLFTASAGMSVVSLASLLRLPGRPRSEARPSNTGFRRSFGDGMKLVRKSRVLVAAFMMIATANMFGFGYEAMAPVFAVDVFGGNSGQLGVLISAPAIGAIAGAMLLAGITARVRRHGLMLVIAVASLNLGILAFALSPWYAISFVILVATGVAGNLFGVMSASLLLLATPVDKQGRILGIQLAVIGAFPLGALLVGLIANAIGPRTALMTMGAAGLALTAAIATGMPELRTWTLSPTRAPARPRVDA